MDELSLKNYAYLGDAVWELFIREKTIYQTQNAQILHKITTDKVKASGQNNLLMQIQDKLTEEESEIMRRSRNLPVPIARKSNQSEYRMATAFEALIGWWYLNDKNRLNEIEEILSKIL